MGPRLGLGAIQDPSDDQAGVGGDARLSWMDDNAVAKRHLAKLGWQEGDGLGKRRDGISRALSVSIKNDNRGIGSKSDDFSFAWWDHVFNKVTASIHVSKEETERGEVTVSQRSGGVVVQKTAYRSFVKGSSDPSQDDRDYSVKVSDAELLAACEGRTARKGARAEQRGKLARAKVLHQGGAAEPAAETTGSSSLGSKKLRRQPSGEEAAESGALEHKAARTPQVGDDTQERKTTKKKRKRAEGEEQRRDDEGAGVAAADATGTTASIEEGQSAEKEEKDTKAAKKKKTETKTKTKKKKRSKEPKKMASQTELFDPPVDGISSVQFSPTDPNLLLASSWDKTVRLYDVASRQVQFRYAHRAAVLDAAFVSDSLLCSGGLDRAVKCVDTATGEERTLGHHDDAVRCVLYSAETGLVVSGGWDRRLNLWDMRSSEHRTIELPEK
ncbi:mitotic spindle checkpoint protein Bub3, partial [Cladochytrium tenue]